MPKLSTLGGWVRAVPGLLLVLGLTSAADFSLATEWFRKGNQAYELGNFEEAVTEYQKAEDAGAADSRLYFNHGNALFRLGRLGPAILLYERARRLSPLDEDIAFNLRFAQSRVADKIPEPEPNLLTRVLWGLHSSYSLRAGVWAAFLLFSLAFILASAAVLLSALARGLALAGMALCLLGLLVFSPSLLYKIRRHETAAYGIVLQPAIEMFSGPGENYQVLARVHEGTRFEIVKRDGDWLSVKLANGKGGYVRSDGLGRI